MIAAEYSGLSVAQMQDLRRRIAEDATLSVVKNTLARRAAEAAKRDDMLEYLAGPTAVVWVKGDPARAAKALGDFAKESDDLFTAKGGLLDGAPLSKEQFVALSKLPSREELLAKLAGGIAAPLFALGGLAQPLNKLAFSLVQLRDQMPADEAPAEDATPAAEAESPPEDAVASDDTESEGSADDAPAVDSTLDPDAEPEADAPEPEAEAPAEPETEAPAEPDADSSSDEPTE